MGRAPRCRRPPLAVRSSGCAAAAAACSLAALPWPAVMSGKAAPKALVAKKASVAVPESQLKKRKTVDALKAKQAAAKVH